MEGIPFWDRSGSFPNAEHELDHFFLFLFVNKGLDLLYHGGIVLRLNKLRGGVGIREGWLLPALVEERGRPLDEVWQECTRKIDSHLLLFDERRVTPHSRLLSIRDFREVGNSRSIRFFPSVQISKGGDER